MPKGIVFLNLVHLFTKFQKQQKNPEGIVFGARTKKEYEPIYYAIDYIIDNLDWRPNFVCPDPRSTSEEVGFKY